MKTMQKIKVALALAVVLATANLGWAAKGGGGGPGISGSMNGSRTEVTVEVTVPQMEAPPTGLCDTANTTQTYSIKAYIFSLQAVYSPSESVPIPKLSLAALLEISR